MSTSNNKPEDSSEKKKRGPKKGAENAGRPLGNKKTAEQKLSERTFTPHAIKKLYEAGLTDTQVAEVLDMSVRSLHYWKQDQTFASLLKESKEVADNLVEQALFKNAIGYTRIKTDLHHYQGKIIKTDVEEYYQGQTAAQFIWLKNRRPDHWRDKHEDDTSSKEELDVKTINVFVNGSKSKLI